MAKTPISALQEHCAIRRYRLPEYRFQDVGTVNSPKFKCSVVCNNLLSEVVAGNKKEAKQECASKMLDKLRMNGERYLPTNVASPQTSPSSENFIGKLNEYASQNGHTAPIYQESPSTGGLFLISCIFINNATAGHGPTKKVAKQKAAEEMWNKIKGTTPETKLTPYKLKISDHETNRIIDTFEKINMAPKIVPKQQEINAKPQKPVYEHRQELDELKLELEQYNFTYKISTFQSKPLVLQLIGSRKIYLFQHGDNVTEAKIALLQMTLSLLRMGYDGETQSLGNYC